MNWPTVKLSEVAPYVPLKMGKTCDDELVLQLTLAHIESNSGILLTKNYLPISAAGSSTHWFDDRYVLYSKLRPYLNKVYLPEEKGLGATELVPMLPDQELLDRNYLAYYLRSKEFVDWVSAQTVGYRWRDLQFEARSQFDDGPKKIAKALLENLIRKGNAKQAFVAELGPASTRK